ncbi:MAG: protein-S-isoprenylcysteine O-methyltransferase Ste14 [Candidatus Paceibacteria bacterium]|jgi:protein-S-isoprenylcysteine O-methyltransferase Ste14
MAALKLSYAVFCYLIGLGGLTYFALFLSGWEILPLHISSKEPGDLYFALAVNLGLILLWSLQHSVMARPAFKRGWTKIVPADLERATYVLGSGIVMLLICWFWEPLEGSAWHFNHNVIEGILVGLYAAGFLGAVAASFMVNHFELFGLQQAYYAAKNRPAPAGAFKEVLFYRIVRHPIQVGMILTLWCTATMGMTRFMLATTMTVYIFIGLYFEEKDLVADLGDDYTDYRARVRALLPLPKKPVGRA